MIEHIQNKKPAMLTSMCIFRKLHFVEQIDANMDKYNEKQNPCNWQRPMTSMQKSYDTFHTINYTKSA